MITPSRLCLSFTLALLSALLAPLPALSQQPPPALPGIPAGWAPPPAQQGFWQKLPDRMRLSMPVNTDIPAFALISNEKIDPRAFTIDFWIAQYTDIVECKFAFHIGTVPGFEKNAKVITLGNQPEENGEYLSLDVNPYTGLDVSGLGNGDYSGNLKNSDGMIHWVRITYDQEKERMMVYVNGQSCDWKDNVRFYGETPLALYFYPARMDENSQKIYNKAQLQLDVLGIRVTDKYLPQAASLPGIAYLGWSGLPAEPNPGCIPAGLEDHLQWLSDNKGLTNAGRGAVLATQVMVDRVNDGNIGAAAWDRALNFLNQDTGKELAGKSLLLPVAIASGSEEQRAQLQPDIQRFFAPLWGHLGLLDRLDQRETVIERMATIDIAMAAETVFSTELGNHVPPELIDDAIPADPDIALGLEYMHICNEGWMQYVAWDMPKLHAISPEFYQMARIFFGECGLRGPMYANGEPELSLSFAAYRLAAIDPGLAVTYWDMMKNPKDRADALDLITYGMPPDILPAAAATKVEAGMKQAVADWQPDDWDSPVPQLYRLARFYQGRSRHDDAVAVVQEAVQKMSKEPGVRFRDVWLVALIARELKLDEAPAWFDAALKLAAADEGGMFVGGRDSFNYATTSAEVLLELAKDGKGDQVLTLVTALGREGLGPNSAAKLAPIVEALAATDLRRAVEVCRLMPEEPREHPLKYDLLTTLGRQILKRDRALASELLRTLPPGPQLTAMVKAAAPDLIQNDLPGIIKLVQSMPAREQPNTVLAIAEVAPIEDAPPLMKLLSDWVAARLKYYAERPTQEKHDLVTQMSALSVSTMMALQPVCATNPDFYTELLLTGVMRAAGLQNDPLWQRLTNAEYSSGGTIEGSAGKLRYAAEQHDPAERFAKPAP